jgi:putative ATPase
VLSISLTASTIRAARHVLSILADVGSLFDEAASRHLGHAAPLAQRMRPGSLDDYIGQEHLVGAGRALRLAIEGDRVPSLVLYGPPGTGKTTLARVIAGTTRAEFVELSAVSATVATVREVLGRARERLGAEGRRTILFLDEIHRFTKAQQDALLPGVEEGLVVLIGATTENPYFELNSALLSRMQVYELRALSHEELATIIERGAAALGLALDEAVRLLIVQRSGGDARTGLAILELAGETARAEQGPLELRHVEDAARKRPLAYDRAGDAHYDTISAWIKSTRAGDVQASLYYLAVMLEGGEDARFIVRRMVILASEDIGNADPRALLVATAAAQALEFVGLPEARLNLAQAAVYLARAPKSNASYRGLQAAVKAVREHGRLNPPDALRPASHSGLAALGRGAGYRYPHEDPLGFEVDCLPERLAGSVFYAPSGNGEEREWRRAAASGEAASLEPTPGEP